MWSHQTHAILEKLYKDDSFKNWNDAIDDGALKNMPEDLDILLRRLSSILVVELETDPEQKDKIHHVLKLAALGGKIL